MITKLIYLLFSMILCSHCLIKHSSIVAIKAKIPVQIASRGCLSYAFGTAVAAIRADKLLASIYADDLLTFFRQTDLDANKQLIFSYCDAC